MVHRMATAALAVLLVTSFAFAQSKKGTAVVYDLTVTADGQPYTGTMTLALSGGKVSGDMHITKPTEITGKPAGTLKGDQMELDFAYRMVERACDGRIAIAIPVPAKNGDAATTGTADIVSCEGNKLTATVEMKPQAPAKK